MDIIEISFSSGFQWYPYMYGFIDKGKIFYAKPGHYYSIFCDWITLCTIQVTWMSDASCIALIEDKTGSNFTIMATVPTI